MPGQRLAGVGGSPPDVAVVRATRLPSFAPAGLLEELTPERLARHGLEAERFLEEPWRSGQSGGRQYAVPPDTHPFVLYYNTDLCEQAGLLDGDGKLRPLDGETALLDACEAIKEETGTAGLVFEIRGVTPWRIFLTLYSQLGGPPIIEEGGTRIGLDDATAVRALEWMAQPNARGVAAPDVDYQGSVAFFGNQSAAFALNGECRSSRRLRAVPAPDRPGHRQHRPQGLSAVRWWTPHLTWGLAFSRMP